MSRRKIEQAKLQYWAGMIRDCQHSGLKTKECGAGKIHCTVDPYGDVKLCPSDEHVLKEEKNNLLEKDMKQIWKDSSVLNWIRGAEFIKCQRCGERCEFSCPLARKERKEEFICSFKQVMH